MMFLELAGEGKPLPILHLARQLRAFSASTSTSHSTPTDPVRFLNWGSTTERYATVCPLKIIYRMAGQL